jgi:membrane protease YdiL (CAAX protease family)
MTRHLLNGRLENRSLTIFFLLVFLLSVPFWVAGPIVERFLPAELSANLPVSALMACAPIIATVILVRRAQGPGAARALLKRAFDYKRIKRTAWYVPIVFLLPAMMVLQYGLLKLMGQELAKPQLPVLMVPVSFVVFFIGALGEEVGWQGYAFGRLQARWNALTASIVLGIVWTLWHVIPFVQMGRTPTWIVWHGLGMVMARILYVWIYKNTGESVFAVSLFHAMHNVSTVLLPSYGWAYDAFVTFVILAGTVATVVFLWGPGTLARYRFARSGRQVPPIAAS